MIRYDVTDLATSPYYLIYCEHRIPGQISTLGEKLGRCHFLLSGGEHQVTVHEREAGSAPQTRGSIYGHLRDKEVSHFNIAGHITIQGSTYLSEVDLETSLPVARRTSNHVGYVVAGEKCWGDSLDVHRTTPSYRYWWNSAGYWQIISQASGHWFLQYDGDKLIFVGESEGPSAYRESDMRLDYAFPRTARMDAYRRSGTSIYYMGSVSKSGSWYSAAERDSYLASIADTGGSLLTIYDWHLVAESDPQAAIELLHGSIVADAGGPSVFAEDHPVDFGELALECASQLRYVDQNILSLIFDVEDWRNFHSLWKNLTNEKGWKAAKAAFERFKAGRGKLTDLVDLFKPGSSTFLFTKYAVLPTVSDCERLLTAAGRSSLYLKQQRLHSRRVTSMDVPNASYATHTAVLTVQCAEYPTWFTGEVQSMIGEMKRWGLYPEMMNLWDIIPYSFVVDWFVPIGDLLTDMDNYLTVKNYFPVEYCIMSEKWEVGKPITSFLPLSGATGDVVYSYYTRWITLEVPLPPVTLEAESTLGNHLVEATALVLQRL